MLATISKKEVLAAVESDISLCEIKHLTEFPQPRTIDDLRLAAFLRYAGGIGTVLRTHRLKATGVLEFLLGLLEKREKRRSQREKRRSQRVVRFIRDAVDRCVPKRGGADIDQVERKVFSLVMREWKRWFSVKWVCGMTAESSVLDTTRFPDTEAELKLRLHSQIVKSTVDGSVLPTLSKGFLYETIKFLHIASACVRAS